MYIHKYSVVLYNINMERSKDLDLLRLVVMAWSNRTERRFV